MDAGKSLAEHKAFIVQESNSSNTAKGELMTAMKATFKSRRSEIDIGNMQTAQVILEYPLLRDSYWVKKHDWFGFCLAVAIKLLMFQLLEEMKLIHSGLNILLNIKEKQRISRHTARIKWKRIPANILAVMGTIL